MLREAEDHLSRGEGVNPVSREPGLSKQTYYRWRKAYGGMKLSQVNKANGPATTPYQVKSRQNRRRNHVPCEHHRIP